MERKSKSRQKYFFLIEKRLIKRGREREVDNLYLWQIVRGVLFYWNFELLWTHLVIYFYFNRFDPTNTSVQFWVFYFHSRNFIRLLKENLNGIFFFFVRKREEYFIFAFKVKIKKFLLFLNNIGENKFIIFGINHFLIFVIKHNWF